MIKIKGHKGLNLKFGLRPKLVANRIPISNYLRIGGINYVK